jgi:hypothetical protein
MIRTCQAAPSGGDNSRHALARHYYADVTYSPVAKLLAQRAKDQSLVPESQATRSKEKD